jgi:hypothetical protein
MKVASRELLGQLSAGLDTKENLPPNCSIEEGTLCEPKPCSE